MQLPAQSPSAAFSNRATTHTPLPTCRPLLPPPAAVVITAAAATIHRLLPLLLLLLLPLAAAAPTLLPCPFLAWRCAAA
jgi:hypothetical protein